MNSNVLKINPSSEVKKTTAFIQKTLKDQGFQKVIIAVSGGIDSTTGLYLLRKSLKPENIIVVHLPYFSSHPSIEKLVSSLEIPKENVHTIWITHMVDAFVKELKTKDKIRLGNIMARVRMIVLYDLAKCFNALVCGTENKSEYYLAYFTRFGDEASDFEPIRHLYKTQVYELADYLKVPKDIIEQSPTAGLWQEQTDEEELGFSYKEGDQVLYLYFEEKQSVDAIEKRGFQKARKIISWANKNAYKHYTPYKL